MFFAAPASAQSDDACNTLWYCVSELNPGLGAADETLDRETPRATMESLITAARNDDWESAAHLLDLSEIPEEEQAQRGAILARQLETVISRKTVINWDDIQDRPDALVADGSSDRPQSGEPRKSLLLWTLHLDRYPASVRLNRIKPDSADAVWVFSRQTVENVPALYELYGPGRFEEMLPPALKTQATFGLMWWEFLGLPFLLALALAIGRLVWIAVEWLSNRTHQPLSRDILRSIRGPASIGAATFLSLVVVSNLFVFSGQINTILSPLAWTGVVGSFLWLVVNSVEVVLDRFTNFDNTDLTHRQQDHKRMTATRIAAARRAFVVAVILVGGGLILTQTNVFENLGLTILGAAGALTLILGFAARRVLGNIMSSMQIALNQSAQIGDRIVYKDRLCHVERINFTYVQLLDWDGTRLVVPVEEFASTHFENWTMKEPQMLRTIKLKCANEADVDALRDAFDRILTELDPEELGDLDRAFVRVAHQDVFGKDVWFALPCADPNTSWDLACEAREKIIAAAAKIAEDRGVDVFPSVTPGEAA